MLTSNATSSEVEIDLGNVRLPDVLQTLKHVETDLGS
jgi:hypothetical protein